MLKGRLEAGSRIPNTLTEQLVERKESVGKREGHSCSSKQAANVY